MAGEYVEIEEDHVAIGDAIDEIIYWDRQEWLDEPDLARVIAQAITILFTEGGGAVRKRLRHLRLVKNPRRRK